MKTKNLKLWLSAAMTSLVIAGCDSQLAINPVNTIDAGTSLATAQGVQVALTGAYDGTALGGVFGGQVMYDAELLADDEEFIFGGTFLALDEVWKKAMIPVNPNAETAWRDSYVTINRANNVLSALDKLPMSERDVTEGEAVFIRGSVYFELAKKFGKFWGDGDNATNLACPIVLTPTNTISEQDNRVRASVADVYARAITDLTRAEAVLPTGTNGIRANKAMAAAMLARVYLAQGRFAEARDAANRVITSSNNYRLAPNFADAFNENASGFANEVVYRLAILETDITGTNSGVNQMNRFFAPAGSGGRGDMRVQAKHLALYDTADIRGRFFVTAAGNRFTRKYAVTGLATVDQYLDIPVIRIAEMFLIRAECNVRLNASTGAAPLEDVNRIRRRAGLADLASVDLAAVLRERRLELAFEGQRLWDLKRTRTNVNAQFPWNSPRLVFPIPQREMDTNKQLVQNAGYGG
jgi:tetratricopeptide (TPR) repeat protein